MKKIYLIMFICSFTATIFAQEKTKPIRENDQVESPKQVKIEQISKIAQNNAVNAVVTYDFTAAGAAYTTGPDPMVEVEPGVWAMIAGDANASGIITNSDKDEVINDLNASGYYPGDTNFSGIVTNSDKDLIINNLNKSSQVPN